MWLYGKQKILEYMKPTRCLGFGCLGFFKDKYISYYFSFNSLLPILGSVIITHRLEVSHVCSAAKADVAFSFCRWTATFLRSLTLYWNEKYVGTTNPGYSHIASSGHLSIADQLLQSLIPFLSSPKCAVDNSNSWQDLTLQNYWHLTKKQKICLEWSWMYCKWSRIYHALKSRTTVGSAEGLDEARRAYLHNHLKL